MQTPAFITSLSSPLFGKPCLVSTFCRRSTTLRRYNVANQFILRCTATVPSTSSEALPEDFRSIGTHDPGLSIERLSHLGRAGWRLIAPFFREDKGARWHLLAVVALTGFFTGLSLTWTMNFGGLITALNEKSVEQFVRALSRLFVLLALVVPSSVTYTYVADIFKVRWERYMTNRLLGMYFSSRNYYKIAAGAAPLIDNPDEVLYEHISKFTKNAFSIVIGNLRTVCDAVAYSVLLLRLSPPLFLVTLALVAVSTGLVNRLGRRLLSLEALYLRLAADFRFALARARIFAESIAFYGGDLREAHDSSHSFNRAIDCQLSIIRVTRWVKAFERTFSFLPMMLPYAYLAPAYFSGAIQMGQVTQASHSFQILTSNLSYFVEQYDWLAYVAASIERLTRFVDYVNSEVPSSMRAFTLPPAATPKLQSNGVVPTSAVIRTVELVNSNELRLSNVTLRTPGSVARELVRGVNVHLSAGERLLIVGASGAGKTSLLRAVAGLWTSGRGEVARAPRDDCFFMPQRPYCVLGSLREQVTYPRAGDDSDLPSDSAICDALERVGLGHLISNDLDAVRNWPDVLSVGETQRIAFARLLLSDARLLILDESTSALDGASEAKVMSLVAAPGRIVVSVGHRPSLVKFHDFVLSIEPNASWTLTRASEFVHRI